MKSIRKQPFFKLFAPKRKSKGALWASLLGIGVSAAVFGATKGKRKDIALPFQNVVKNFSPKTNLNLMNNAALTEFSEELMESALQNDR
ncbi:hypothetical protein J1P26_20345 [Neobacillus sp. MM2021_6]|uniref:hypothetical protein n=1 Tax=Bacillaceae TaxID=186817 RepID=UPI001409E9D9|nr:MULTISPECIES: hypothetical protein [Bacillaceae]MBO0962060.1 hypothetical protein [Neobacillus sp. MM2021_6]NHC19967.1 hypothetical protein [Bacillus sp. MM2020_4]